ncbi:MAG: PASTA domain-containing protein [Candidatus Margulisbacteria bacterium]|nr:PASTA domain-containing protein [Candidatus Margulisiibacteriota bacterium]
MDIKTNKHTVIRSRYIVQSKLFSDIFYDLFDGVDQQHHHPVFIVKCHQHLVSPSFVDHCIDAMQGYLYQPIDGLFELIDFEFDGESFYIFYKNQFKPLMSLDLYLKQMAKRSDWPNIRQTILIDSANVLYQMENKGLVFGSFSLNNIFVEEGGQVIFGPPMLNLICIEYFISKINDYDASIFLTPEFLKDQQVSLKTDIYGLGILAYYLYTSTWPYQYKNSVAKLKEGFVHGPDATSKRIQSIGDKLHFYIMKSIQLDPKTRWQSFKTVIGILEGKQNVTFEKLSNRLEVSESFASEINQERRSKLGRVIHRLSNGFLLFLVGVLLYVGYVSYFTKYKVVQLPDLTETSLIQAKQALVNLGLNPTSVSYNFHQSIPEGHVVRIEPPSGRSIKQGRSVKLFVSKGRQEIQVPALIGKTRQGIAFILNGTGINIKEMPDEYSMTVPQGKVIRQLPLPNQYMFDSGTIQLVFSKGAPVSIEWKDDLNLEGVEVTSIDVAFTFTSEMDDAEFVVLEEMRNGDTRQLYSGTHYGGDQFNESFMVQKTSHIKIQLNGQPLFSSNNDN